MDLWDTSEIQLTVQGKQTQLASMKWLKMFDSSFHVLCVHINLCRHMCMLRNKVIFYNLFLSFFLFGYWSFETGFLCVNHLGCPRTFFVDHVGFELTEIHLPLYLSSGTKDMHCHAQAKPLGLRKSNFLSNLLISIIIYSLFFENQFSRVPLWA